MLSLTAISFGLLGSFHCIGMCGPIAFALPLNRSNQATKVTGILFYNFGRVITYSLLGFIAGLIGSSIHFYGLQRSVSIAIGLLLILSVLFPKYAGNTFFGNKVVDLQRRMTEKLRYVIKRKGNIALLTTGILNGFLPCGLVYMALGASLLSEGVLEGIAYMALFGFGTIPLMSVASLTGANIKISWRNRIRRSIPYILVFFGLLFVLRGMNLGIPFVSPEIDSQSTEVKNCH